MRRDDLHLYKAKQNEDFADRLDRSTVVNTEWAVTSTFYSALHYVEAYFAKCNVKCENHADREQKFKSDARIRVAWSPYSYLFQLSKLARYYTNGLPPEPYRQASAGLQAVKKQVEHALKSLET